MRVKEKEKVEEEHEDISEFSITKLIKETIYQIL